MSSNRINTCTLDCEIERRPKLSLYLFLVAVVSGVWFTGSSTLAADSKEVFFEKRIRPVLVKHCYECHSSAAAEAKGGLRLDFRDGLTTGGDSGSAIKRGKPEASLLIESLRYESFEMPPDKPLPDHVIADFEKWIRDGAVDPRDRPPSAIESSEQTWKAQLAQRRQWWSLQPPQDVKPPDVDRPQWSAEPVDRFIYSRLDSEGLHPTSPASPLVLLRRLSFVLTGLPPHPQKVESFPAEYAADPDLALARLVNELLDSPHFGERFARHWMDVVRYTDTYGYEWDIPAKGSWEYRDYLIRAFNSDVGFDQIICEQIAGDLLPEPRINEQDGLNESIIGPMFYHMGEHRHGSSLAFNGIHQEMIDNKIDAFSKAFLGMTVACARCHNHKLDAISQRDYYALAGMFMTPRWTARPIDSADKYADQIAELKQLRSKIHRSLGHTWKDDRGPLVSGAALYEWAFANRVKLQHSKPNDIAWPLRQLLDSTTWLKSSDVTAAASNQATELTVSSDGSILASGPVPDRDQYTVTFTTQPGQATSIQLEALTHDSLGSRGPGRTAHGNFVLSEIDVQVARLPSTENSSLSAEVTDLQSNEFVPASLSSASADYSQPNYPVESALKSVHGSGWGVGLGGNVDRAAQFYFSEPIALPHGGKWTVRLKFELGTQHVLGRFRLAVGGNSTSSEPADSVRSQDARASETWTQIANQWLQEHEKRVQDNKRFAPLTDFSNPDFPTGWVAEGAGMQHGHVTSGTPRISLQGGQLIAEFLDAGYHTRALSPKLPGALRLPAPESFERERVTLKLAGGEWAGRRDIPQNAFLQEGPMFFDPRAKPTWFGVAAPKLSNGVTRVLTEISTASLNSNFPLRTGVATAGGVTLPNEDEGFDKASWFSITGIVSHDGGGGPHENLDEFTPLYTGAPPATADACWERIRDWLAGAVDRWAAGHSTAGDVRVLNWMLNSGLLSNDPASHSQELVTLVDRYRAVEQTIQMSRSVNSMDERGVRPVNYRLNIRGDVYEEGDAVPRGFLEIFEEADSVGHGEGSGRLALADYLSSPDNPQTARVYVNRVWQWIFGKGLVSTPNDFGKLGDRPSHPELLDWLANQFMKEGWSTKKLVRRLVLSQTFRQSGDVSQNALEFDPDNRLLHHYPTRRLEAEAIRDSLLAVAGTLDPTLYGRPINPPRSVEDSAKRLFSGPVDSHGRRSIYIEMSIMDPPKFLVGFNLPNIRLPTGRRDETNVPAQSLIMLNDPLVVQQASSWGKSLVSDESKTPQQRIERMFVKALGRNPSEQELARWTEALTNFGSSDKSMNDREAWTALAHALLNTKEFLYFR